MTEYDFLLSKRWFKEERAHYFVSIASEQILLQETHDYSYASGLCLVANHSKQNIAIGKANLAISNKLQDAAKRSTNHVR